MDYGLHNLAVDPWLEVQRGLSEYLLTRRARHIADHTFDIRNNFLYVFLVDLHIGGFFISGCVHGVNFFKFFKLFVCFCDLNLCHLLPIKQLSDIVVLLPKLRFDLPDTSLRLTQSLRQPYDLNSQCFKPISLQFN